jgi:hypothetical protein
MLPEVVHGVVVVVLLLLRGVGTGSGAAAAAAGELYIRAAVVVGRGWG